MFHLAFNKSSRSIVKTRNQHRRRFRKLLSEQLLSRSLMACDLDLVHSQQGCNCGGCGCVNCGGGADELHGFPLPTADVILATSTPPAPAPAPLADTFKLHSNPDALHTIYLDFDGHTAIGTQWNTWKNIPTITTAAWDPSGDGAPVNAIEQSMIQGIWQRVAEDFAPFNVNVTTEDPGPDAFRKSGVDDTRWGIRVIITPTDWSRSGVGGHAWIGSFNSEVDEGCYVYNPTEITVSAAVSHEVGHAMYLSHDGQNTTTYYGGHGTGETSWGPIMGSGYYANVTTWDTGSYYATNNSGVAANYGRGADDYLVITGFNGFGAVADDHGADLANATPMTYVGSNSAKPNRYDVGTFGVIGRFTDQDLFKFTVGTGTVDLTIDSYFSRYYASNGDGTYDLGYAPTPAGSDSFKSQGSNLDVRARLYDLSGNLVATSNPAGLSAFFSNLYLQAGTYFISVDGAGLGNWMVNPPTGFSNLVSLGQYYIRGTVIKPDAANTNPVANPDSVVTKTNTAVSFSVMANDADDEGDPLSLIDVTVPANGTLTWTADGQMNYTPATNFVGVDSFTYTISDGRGGTAIGSISVQVQSTISLAKTRYSAGENIPVTFLGGPGNADDRIAVYANGQVPGTVAPVAWYYTNGTRTPGGSLTAGKVTLDADSGTWPLAAGGYFVTMQREGDLSEIAARASFRINSAPVAVSDVATTPEDTSVTIMLIANDTDADGDALTLLDVTSPSHGTNVRNINGWVHYTPALNYFGPDSFTYSIQDGYGATATATVNVMVMPVNDAPTAVTDYSTTLEDTPVTIAVLANDSDVDGDALSVIAKTNGTRGSVAINVDGTLTYTPNVNAYGSDAFSYTISDGRGGTRLGFVYVTITATQDPPVAVNDTVTAYENTANFFVVTSNDSDPDGNPLSVSSWTNPAHGSVAILGSGIATYTPVTNYIGPDSFAYTITDGYGNYATATVTLNVLWVNDPPIAGPDSTTTIEETSVTIAVLANDSDVDGGTLSVTNRTNGAKGTTSIVDSSTVRYTPNLNANGLDIFTYTVSDGQGGSTVGTVTVSITPTNDAPTASADSVATDEDVPVTFNVLANDSDVDGDVLTVTSWTTPAHGTIAISAAGVATYTPNFGYIGTDSFAYNVVDPHGLSSSATVSLNVRAVATLELNKLSFLSGELISATFDDGPGLPNDWLGIFRSDSSPSGSYLNRLYTNNTSSPGGSLTSGVVTFGPSSGSWPLSYGSYYVTFLTDALTELTPRAYFIVNAVPVAADDAAKTNEDTSTTIDVLSNDSDPDSQNALTLVSVTSPAHGTVEIVDNSVRYSPALNYVGEDFFRYTIRDGYGATASAEIKVTVEPVKDPPVAVTDYVTTLEDTATTIAVLANDTDPDSDRSSLKVTNATNGSKGTVQIINDTQVRYAPYANVNGTDTITYTVDDGDGGFSVGTVTVSITPVNDLPIARNDTAVTLANASVTIGALANDTDVDADTLTVTARTNGSLGTVVINADATLTYTPNVNVSGSDTFTYTISDGRGGTAVGIVTVTITPENGAPIARADSAVTNEDVRVTFSLLTNDTDPDGDAFTVTSWTNPTNGTVTITANGQATYTPVANFFGTDNFTYTITDVTGRISSATVSLVVNSVNDRPIVVGDFVTTAEDTAISILALANDTDIDGGTLSITARTNGARGTVVIVGGTSVTYSPNANVYGTDSFTYTVSDGQGATTVGTVSVTITAVNDAPVALNDTSMTTGTTAVTIAVLANDNDVDADPLSAQLVSNPSNGTSVANANGTFTYVANVGFTGTDSFTYRAFDGQATSGLATVTITVHGPTRFTVVDSGTDQTYRYQENGVFTASTATSSLNRGAVGMASSSDGSRQWVLDSNRNVYVYNATGALLGSWTASGLDTPKGISVHGSEVWIVDSGTDRVYLFADATTRLSGSQAAVRNFRLPTTNRNPEDLVTDGTTIWVLQSGSPDKVFAYRNSDGVELGNWTIDAANTNPVGVTLDPTGANQGLWIVDSVKDRVYEYANGRSHLSGSHLATRSFALNSGNATPQGIAWIGTPNAPAASSLPAEGNRKLVAEAPIRREIDRNEIEDSDDNDSIDSNFFLAESSSNKRLRLESVGPRRKSAWVVDEWARSVDNIFADEVICCELTENI
jgi:hypothetical protein